MDSEEYFFLSIFRTQNLTQTHKIKTNVKPPILFSIFCQRLCDSFHILFGFGVWGFGLGVFWFTVPAADRYNICPLTMIMDHVETGSLAEYQGCVCESFKKTA